MSGCGWSEESAQEYQERRQEEVKQEISDTDPQRVVEAMRLGDVGLVIAVQDGDVSITEGLLAAYEMGIRTGLKEAKELSVPPDPLAALQALFGIQPEPETVTLPVKRIDWYG